MKRFRLVLEEYEDDDTCPPKPVVVPHKPAGPCVAAARKGTQPAQNIDGIYNRPAGQSLQLTTLHHATKESEQSVAVPG